MAKRNPLDRLLGLYTQIAELQRFRSLEDGSMTDKERSESDAVIADLEEAAEHLKAVRGIEIQVERFARLASEITRLGREAEELLERGRLHEAEEVVQQARTAIKLAGMLRGEFKTGSEEE